ncbi:hypothetical protein EJB05_20053 [Eragrostis curvula]|uniref:Inositol polyphosphate-related phosphatase domain-containing protein n=1 Tax=Eragrostis curvula TaxID=38414 RepID=A0A5J9UXA8_9POAL|nr:hypothetical protein EJB05_20053 [Eragrostis curvula]
MRVLPAASFTASWMSNHSAPLDIPKPASVDDFVKNGKKKKSFMSSIFRKKGRSSDKKLLARRDVVFDLGEKCSDRMELPDESPAVRKSFSDRHCTTRIESLSLSCLDSPRRPNIDTREYRLEQACIDNLAGFQEIVPLSAGNVLVVEDNEPAAKWLALIYQALNKPPAQEGPSSGDEFSPPETSTSSQTQSRQGARDATAAAIPKSSSGGLLFFQKPSLKMLSKNYRVDSALVKTCTCMSDPSAMQRRAREMREFIYRVEAAAAVLLAGPRRRRRRRRFHERLRRSAGRRRRRHELLPHREQADGRHLPVGVGAAGARAVRRPSQGGLRRQGNHGAPREQGPVFRVQMIQGCIAMSMTLHQTSICFVCCHLASGEKEGDEVRRNSDVAEILKSTQFPRICKIPGQRIPEKIIDHDRIIWLGDLNYRVALSYEETKMLLEGNEWETLLENDQLVIERQAGRVFKGWKEGKIYFAPTYKYTRNSDSYVWDSAKSKKKRRTPAWCDRILWHGQGIEQLQYIRGEFKLSDHRPVCSVFVIEADVDNGSKIKKGYSTLDARIHCESPAIPKRHSFYDDF